MGNFLGPAAPFKVMWKDLSRHRLGKQEFDQEPCSGVSYALAQKREEEGHVFVLIGDEQTKGRYPGSQDSGKGGLKT